MVSGEGNEYERLRDERVRRNRAVLASLGLNDGLLCAKPAARIRRRTPVAREEEAEVEEPHAKRPLRRSARTCPSSAAPVEVEEAAAEEAAVPAVNFKSSLVCLYGAEADGSSAWSWDSGDASDGRPDSLLASVRPARLFSDAGLSRVYCAHARDGLLALAGHEGRCAVFAARGGEALLSWRAHGGWASGLSLLGEGRLLTASNDATAALWDLRSAAEGAPRRLAVFDALHARGVFALHAPAADVIWTASKDGSSRLSRLLGAGLEPGRVFRGAHSGVVKCVRARPGDCRVAADGGADGAICLLDARAAAAAVLTLPAAHAGGVNALDWQAGCWGGPAPLLLSAGGDPVARLWDVRQPRGALHALTGHCHPSVGARLKGIYRPAFVAGGAAVAAPGPGWARLSLFCARGGAGLGQTELEEECSAAFSAAPEVRGGGLLLLRRGGACLMRPFFAERVDSVLSSGLSF